MTCSQCQRPALYRFREGAESYALCLSCYAVLEDIQFKKFLKISAMLNQSLDDLDRVAPWGPRSGRIPVAEVARAASQSRTYNNIKIDNSTVGMLNTGNLQRIDAAITISKGNDTEEFGARLKDLTDTILKSSEVDAQSQQQLLEVVQAISDQVIGAKPSKPVVSALFGKLKEMASNTASIGGAVEKLHSAWLYLSTIL